MVLPDGSACMTLSLPLPDDHWLYEKDEEGFIAPPPMPMRMGEGLERSLLSADLETAARWAIQASTMNGKEMDFDPDAMVKNFIVGLLGYWTPDGRGSEPWQNPDPCPPIFKR